MDPTCNESGKSGELSLKSLRWSDNTCTVGHTTIWALMTAEDMEWLLQMQPRGRFTNTFFYAGPRGNNDWINYARVQNGLHGFYFNFPEDERGKTLIIALRMLGMGDRGV